MSVPKLDLTSIEPVRQKLQAVRHDIESFVFEREDHIKMAILALLAGEHVILVGPPGVAKSMIINQLTNRITGVQMFELLMHPQVSATDLFVSDQTIEMTTDPSGCQSLRTVYHTNGGVTMATAEVAFLDEIYKANGKTLNALLTLINERKYDLNRQRHDAPLISLFTASNELPEIDGSDGLAAFHDRLLVRLPTEPVRQFDNKIKIFKTQLAHRNNLATGTVPPMATIDLAELAQLQQLVPQIYVPLDVMERLLVLADLVSKEMDIYLSPRRVERALKLLQARALLAGRSAVEKKDLTTVRFAFWEDPDKFDETEELIRENVLDPEERRLGEIKKSAFELLQQWERRIKDGDIWGEGTQEEMMGVNGCLRELEQFRQSISLPNRPLMDRIDELRTEITQERNRVLQLMG